MGRHWSWDRCLGATHLVQSPCFAGGTARTRQWEYQGQNVHPTCLVQHFSSLTPEQHHGTQKHSSALSPSPTSLQAQVRAVPTGGNSRWKHKHPALSFPLTLWGTISALCRAEAIFTPWFRLNTFDLIPTFFPPIPCHHFSSFHSKTREWQS